MSEGIVVGSLDALNKIEDFLDDGKTENVLVKRTSQSTIGVNPQRVDLTGGGAGGESRDALNIPASTKTKRTGDAEQFISRSMPEIHNYKTKLNGWSSSQESEGIHSPIASPIMLGGVPEGKGVQFGHTPSSPVVAPGPPLMFRKIETEVERKHSQSAGSSPEPTSELTQNFESKATLRSIVNPGPGAVAGSADITSVAVVNGPAAPAGAAEADGKGKKKQKKEKGNRGPPEGIKPKPKLSKAERRALQNAQRAAKDGIKPGAAAGGKKEAAPGGASAKTGKTGGDAVAASGSEGGTGRQKKAKAPTVEHFRENAALLSHLPVHYSMASNEDREKKRKKLMSGVHPEIVRLGLKYAHGKITESNERTKALLAVLKKVLHDYELPKGEQIRHDLMRHVGTQITYLVMCRPLSASMGTAIKWFKRLIVNIDTTKSLEEVEDELAEEIDLFVLEQIVHPYTQIAKYGASCLKDEDVVLVYGYSELVCNVLAQVAARPESGVRVVVVDSRPGCDGKVMAAKLISLGMEVTFVQLHAVCYIMKEVTKVFLNAEALLSNGSVYARGGTAIIAAAAFHCRVPNIVCCESYKFIESTNLDAIVTNEIGDPEMLLRDDHGNKHTPLKEWTTTDNVKLLNLTYDLTPMKYVQLVVTDVGMVPPTSVPVVLREYQKHQ